MAYISCLKIIEKSVKSVHHVPTEGFLYFKVITNKLIDLEGSSFKTKFYTKKDDIYQANLREWIYVK